MNKLNLFSLATQFAPGIFRVRPGTWIAVGLGMLALMGLLIWVAMASIGWLWEQARRWDLVAPEVARGVIEQVEQAAPGAREKIGEFVPALKPEPPPRDVSGTDIGPVARYPGLTRAHWHREGAEIIVRYEGAAGYAAVLEHYVKGFTAQGYAQNVLSASAGSEKHEYLKGSDRVGFEIAQLPKGKVKISLVAVLPAPTFGKAQS